MILIEKDIMVVKVINVLNRETGKPPHAPSLFCSARIHRFAVLRLSRGHCTFRNSVIIVDYLTVQRR